MRFGFLSGTHELVTADDECYGKIPDDSAVCVECYHRLYVKTENGVHVYKHLGETRCHLENVRDF